MPNDGDILNFDLCDLQMYVKSKIQVVCHDKNLGLIQPFVQEYNVRALCLYSKMAPGGHI
jgi:hypothetical protein